MEQETVVQEEARKGTLSSTTKKRRDSSDDLIYYLLLGLLFLLPVAFIPSATIAIGAVKSILLVTVTVLALVIWLYRRLKDGVFHIPRSAILYSAAAVVLAFLVSALLSPAKTVSLIGTGSEVGTFDGILASVLLLFLVSVSFQKKERLLYALLTFLGSFVLVFLYQVIRVLFGPEALSFGIYTSPIFSIVGEWNDLAVLFGATIFLSVLTIHFFSVNKMLRVFSYVAFYAALFFIILINFYILWILLLLFAVTIGGYLAHGNIKRHRMKVRAKEAEDELVATVSNDGEKGNDTGIKNYLKKMSAHVKYFPVLPLILLIVSLFFLLGFNLKPIGDGSYTLSSLLAERTNTVNIPEVVLSMRSTMDIARGALGDDLLFGSGPNRFAQVFYLNKPSGINQTLLWNSTFSSGFGHVPTFVVTTGIVGGIALVLLLLSVLLSGRKIRILLKSTDKVLRYLALSIYTLSIYFWVMMFFYTPNLAVFTITFFITGLLVALLTSEKLVKTCDFSYVEKQQYSFIVVPLLVVGILGGVVWEYMHINMFRSAHAFQKAQVIQVTEGDLVQAEKTLKRGVAISEYDAYYRVLVDYEMAKLEQLINREGLSEEELGAEVQRIVQTSTNYANKAIAFDETNYRNHVALGFIYEVLATLGVPDAGPVARDNYTVALNLAPNNPSIMLSLARSEILSGNTERAKKFLTEALAQRPNYVEALSILSQMEIQSGDIEKAISVTKDGALASPDDFTILFNLGFLQYANKNYELAVEALENSVRLNPFYSNAKYFLGLSYAKVGRTDEAVAQFIDVQSLNPENKDVENILRNLKAGRGPFDNGAASSAVLSPVIPEEDETNETGDIVPGEEVSTDEG